MVGSEYLRPGEDCVGHLVSLPVQLRDSLGIRPDGRYRARYFIFQISDAGGESTSLLCGGSQAAARIWSSPQGAKRVPPHPRPSERVCALFSRSVLSARTHISDCMTRSLCEDQLAFISSRLTIRNAKRKDLELRKAK